MADPSMMLQDLEGFRGASRRRSWLVVVGVVILCTATAIMIVRQSGRERPAQGEEPEADAAGSPPAPPPVVGRSATAEPPAPEALPPEVARMLDQAKADEQADRLVEARAGYLALLARDDCGTARPFVEERLAYANVLLVTTPRAMPEKVDYAIQSGDSIKVLARRFACPAELIVKANNITNPDLIQIGDRLRVLDKPPFAILIDKSDNDLLLTLGGAFFKRFRVGTGQFGRTPVGTFRVDDKIAEPPWWRPDGKVIPFGDPENILGTRWLSLAAIGETPPARGYGIHGTWDDTTLGKQSSAGCIRMNNAEVELLYMLTPVGTPVTIRD